MKTDYIFILTFAAKVAEDVDREVRNSAAALYFKHASRGKRIAWWQCEGNTSSVVFNLNTSTFSHSPAQGTVGVYAVAHGGGGNFGGFGPPENGAVILHAFMTAAGLTAIDQLNLVACAVAKGPNGPTYLKNLAEHFLRDKQHNHALKLVAWANWVTVFDVRYLVNLVSDPDKRGPEVKKFMGELLDMLKKGGAKEDIIQALQDDTVALNDQPLMGKKVNPYRSKFLYESLEENPSSLPEAAKLLYGKKVSKMTQSIDMFTRDTGLTRKTGETFKRPESLPAETVEAIAKAISHKVAQTFVWEIDTTTGKGYLRQGT